MPDLRSIAHECEPLASASRCLFISVSQEDARIQDSDLCRMASFPDREERAQASAIMESEAAAAPPKEQIPTCWGHQNASYWLMLTEVDSQASCYASEELHIAATLCAAELQVSRNIQLSEVELRIFSLATSANELVPGRRKAASSALSNSRRARRKTIEFPSP